MRNLAGRLFKRFERSRIGRVWSWNLVPQLRVIKSTWWPVLVFALAGFLLAAGFGIIVGIVDGSSAVWEWAKDLVLAAASVFFAVVAGYFLFLVQQWNLKRGETERIKSLLFRELDEIRSEFQEPKNVTARGPEGRTYYIDREERAQRSDPRDFEGSLYQRYLDSSLLQEAYSSGVMPTRCEIHVQFLIKLLKEHNRFVEHMASLAIRYDNDESQSSRYQTVAVRVSRYQRRIVEQLRKVREILDETGFM